MSDSVQKYSASRMGSAPIGPLLLSCSVPMMISMLVQALYNIVDSIFVSRVNEAALSAVSLAFPIQNLMIAFAVGTAVGVNAYLSRCLGEGNRAEASRAAMNGLFLAFCGGIAFLVFGILGARAFIASQTTDAQIMQYGADYLSICTLWCMGLFLQCMLEKLLVATGRSAFAMASQLIGALVNIALDLLFVAKFGMGVYGAAWATVIALALSWLCSIWYIRRYAPELEFPLLPHRFDGKTLRKMIQIGLPLGMNTALYSTGHLILQILFNLQGSTFVAGCSVAGKVASFANLAIASLSSTMTVFSGQNLGAGNYRRLCRGAWLVPLCAGTITLSAGILVTIFCNPLLSLFTQDVTVLAVAVRYIHIVLPFTWMYAIMNVIMCFANGIGEIKYPTIVNLFILWGVRIPVAYLLSRLGYGGYAMASVPLSFLAGMILMLFYFRTKRWAKLCALAKNEP